MTSLHALRSTPYAILAPYETGHVSEPVARMDRARQLDERAVFAIITSRRERGRTSRLGLEQLRLPLVERDRLDALLDSGDADAICPLEHRRDRAVDPLEIALEVWQPRVQVGCRHANRIRRIRYRAQAVDPQPGTPDAALQLIGERGIAHESLLRQNLDARVVRILEKIADRVGRLPVARRRRARQHFRSDAPLARDETDVAQFAQCLAHRRAADAVLLAELHLGGQQSADGINATSDAVDELIRNLQIARAVRDARATPGASVARGAHGRGSPFSRCTPHVMARSCCRIRDRNSRARSVCGSAKNACVSRSSTMRPRSMNIMRSATCRANAISCVTTTIVMPSSASLVMTASTSLIISGSSADVGSSKSMATGSIASARAIAIRCCWPPDSADGYFLAWSTRPTRSRSTMDRSVALRGSRFKTRTWARSRFSMTVRCGNSSKLWKTIPTRARRAFRSVPGACTDLPSTVISPASIRSRPLMHRISVLLPDPDGPQTTTT